VNSPITPLDGWVVIKPLPAEEEKTANGIIMSVNLSSAEIEKRKNKGTVLATPKESPVAEGCTVYYKSYAGQDCYISGEIDKYLLVEFQDICGVLK